MQARKAMAVEDRRRADWRRRELVARSFEAECDHVDAAPVPHLAHDLVE